MNNLPRFSTPIRVRFYETDLQGHVNFIWHQSYFSIAVGEYLKTIGWPYARFKEEGYDLLIVDAHASFSGPAFFDETLHVHCRIERIGDTSIRFAFVTRAEDGDRPIATGDLTAVMVDHTTRKKVPVPAAFRTAVGEDG